MAAPSTSKVEFRIGADDAGLRLDQALARHVPELSRRGARVLLDIGGVFVDGRRTKVASRPMREGETVVAHVGGAFRRATKQVGQGARAKDAEELPAYKVVFEDEDLIVVDKPAGLLTAPTPESDRGNLADLLARREGAAGPVFVVHRIDLPTSGLLVFAKTPAANRALSELFRIHDVGREYVAVVAGRFPDDLKTISRKIEGRRAVTHTEVVRRFRDHATLLRCRLETGRTHQIRIHARGVRHPVLGDPELGTPPGLPPPPRMALHAAKLAFVHPRTGEVLSFESAVPEDLGHWLERLETTVGALLPANDG